MVSKSSVLRFFSRFFIYVLFVGLIITTSVLYNVFKSPGYTDSSWDNVTPYDVPGNLNGNNVVFDQHSHTIHSDGDLTMRQNILWHQSMGYNACVITDHNTMDHKSDVESLSTEFAGDFVVILGLEWTTDRIHMNFLGLNDWNFDNFPVPDEPTDQEIQDAINEAHNQGAVVTVNHIPWSLYQSKMENHPSRHQLLDWGVDFIEIVNDDSAIENVYDYDSLDWCNDTGFGMITGTDMHEPDHMESGAIHGYTLLNATSFTTEGIMAQLRDHNTTIVYNRDGYDDIGDYSNIIKDVMQPLDWIGSLFVNLWDDTLDWTGVLLYVGFFIDIFLIIELYNYLKPKLWKKIDMIRKNST